MDVLLKYLPLVGLVLNTPRLAKYSVLKDVLFRDGTELLAFNVDPERVEIMKSLYTKHRILTILGYVFLFIGITIQGIPTLLEALKT